MRALVCVLVLALAAGCATTQPSAYQKGAALPTPNSLSPNSRWAFVLLDWDGRVAANIVVRLSNIPAITCDGVGYRSAEVISEHRSDGIPLYSPAYYVEGAALRIQLSTGLCDNGYAIIGSVTEAGFEGIHTPETLIAAKSERTAVLRAFGVPILD
jgi:hypothetical protein